MASPITSSNEHHLQAISTLLHFISTQRPSDTPIPNANTVVVTSTGFSGVLRLIIKQAAQLAGMQYNGSLTKHTTVVIAANDQPSAKLQTALLHGIPIVQPLWLADTVASGRLQPTDNYFYPTCTPTIEECGPTRGSTRRSYTSIELEVLRYTASPAVHDPRTLASVLRAARLIDTATQAPPHCDHNALQQEQPLVAPLQQERSSLHQEQPLASPTHLVDLHPSHMPPFPPHMLVRVGATVAHPPRSLVHAVHERHGHGCQPRFHSSVEVSLPNDRTLRFDVHGTTRVPLVLPDGVDDNHNPSQLAAVRLEGVYDLGGMVWLAHYYYLNQGDLQRVPGGPPSLTPHELVLRRKLYHSPAASIRGAALVFGRRGTFMRHVGRAGDDVDAVYFCERVHAG